VSIDPKFGRYCDACGRGIQNAVRIHLGKDYCRSCYQMNFVRVDCVECKQPMRQHRHAEGEPVCKACIRSKRTCLRCGKFTPLAGKLVGSSAVCGACSPHFRERRPCTGCGRLSSRLSRPLFTGLQDELCDSCRRGLTDATCAVCRKHRRVAGRNEGGKPLCKDCLPGQEVSHDCPQCGTRVPGGGLARCRGCANRESVQRLALVVSASFEAQWVRELWKGFVALQLEEAASSPKLRQTLDRASSFFAALEKSFASAEEIDAQSLAERMDSRLLRKHLLASRFLVATLELNETEGNREIATERRRIAQIISRCGKAKYGEVLEHYVEWLRAAGVADRTARLYLRAAESFCADAGVDASQAWREQDALRYLAKMPGHAASLSRFFRYCRECRGWDVCLPPRSLWVGTPAKRDADQIKRLRKALQRVGGMDTAILTTREVARLLSLAVGLPATQLLREREAGRVVLHGDGSVELAPQAVIATADALYPYARRWLDLAA